MRFWRQVSLFCLAAAAPVFAQTPSASVVGRISDATGAVIPGVSVKVTNLDTNFSQQSVSNELGEFRVLHLNPGRYNLEATSAGFRTHKQEEFLLAVDQALRIDFPLEVGATSESVTVSEAPPQLNTETFTRGEVTTQEEIKELPLDGRDFNDLALLTGGVIPKGDGGDGTFAVNGGRADNSGFLLDGMNNTQRRNTGAMINPPIEGVQEFKMLTSGFSAEYGRYAGGMLTVVTKSGTNRLRGSLYEFVRNDMLDATGYFDGSKTKLRRNQFGATVGGPLFIPKLYNGKNRTFFMVTWDSLRLIDGRAIRTVVPEPEMLRGDFSRAVDAFGRPVPITDTLNRTPFPNSQIPASRLDPVSQKIGQFYPAPNFRAGVFNFLSTGNATQSFNNFGVKADHNLTPRDRLTMSTFWRNNESWNPVVTSRSPIPIFGSANNTLNLLSYVRYLRSITPTMFLEASVNFSRRTNNEVWPYSGDRHWAAETGFLGGTTNPVAAGPPYVQVTSYMNLGPANDIPKIWSFNNYQYSANTTWIKGRHSVKFGGDFLRSQYFSRSYGDTRGRISFDGRFTGVSAADFVLGWANSSRRQLDASGPYALVSNYSAFLQDDFKVSRSLTLNLGLRYELIKPPKEKFGGWAMFMPALGQVVVAGTGSLPQEEFQQRITSTGLAAYVVKASDVGLPPTITQIDWTNLAPRGGFAWRILGSTKSVLRGGYGIFYGTSSLYRMDEYADTFPFSITETFSRLSSDPTILTMSNPYPSVRRGFSGVNSSYGQETSQPKSQYLQSWNLTFERDLWGTVVEVAYAGSKGTHLQRRYDLNQAGRSQEESTIRPFPFFGSINVISDGSNSIYSSGQLTVRRRFSKQLFVRASYTYAKSIDESSNTGGTIQYNFSQAQDARNLRLERGRSDFDIGHSFAGSFIWTPQYSRHWMARGWQLAGASTIYSGPPFTPRVANVTFAAGEATRPDRIAKGAVDRPSPDLWYDRFAFPVVPTGSYRFGNSGRNILDGPGTIAINMSLSRRFTLAEKRTLQFRLETFNLPNHPNFNLPENNVNVLAAGTISRAKNNRNLQLGLRMEF
ncbi:MAG: TonB-dependent receptor [Acidimicrobiia bacterium]|nr:TonB-dependent receptor [Acidimicrobiia bacterium]